MLRSRILLALLPAVLLGACNGREAARADSLQAAAAEQLRLMDQLAAQKDSLTNVVLDADRFIAQIDSQIAKAKGLKQQRRDSLADPMAAQLQERKLMLERVSQLVERANATANQLAASRRREAELRGQVASLQESLERDRRTITELGATIERQQATILALETRVDSLTRESQRLGEEIRTLGDRHYRAYYIVGTERELLEKGVIQREGGANLLVARVGRTLQPARMLDSSLFTAIDQRETVDIPVPDSTKRYRIVSRQTLDGAVVQERDGTTFRGGLHISDPARFWAPSRFLILVER